ncbi:iron chelate uptake ABC transporter family permease subunit [Serratia symbiotica]|uniref:iron chelate uptake ABC transporter family permease subunit n=1 Tax=Serratia symbiotica TaxID=138074 RepID=UPI0030D5B916|nr:iron chelate uptake ABC transporter family permease subunit [Serratia symbiotica]
MGAYTGALITIILFSGGYYHIAIGALAGSLLSAVVIYLLAWRKGIVDFQLIIVGIAISVVLVSTKHLADHHRFCVTCHGCRHMAGWFSQWINLAKIPASNRIGLSASAALLMSKRLQQLEIGDDAAQALGVNAESSRMWLMLFGVPLTAAATAAAGPISFIALAARQIARCLTGKSSVTLTLSALVGATLLLGVDTISQPLFAPIQLSVGVVTVRIGGLYLIWLLIRESRR